MLDLDKERLLRIYATFEMQKEGSQLKKLSEEQQELNNALLLHKYGINPIEDVIQELADNFILLYQHIYANEIDLDKLKEYILMKLDRTEARIVQKYYEK